VSLSSIAGEDIITNGEDNKLEFVAVHEIELKPGVNPEEFERFLLNDWLERVARGMGNMRLFSLMTALRITIEYGHHPGRSRRKYWKFDRERAGICNKKNFRRCLCTWRRLRTTRLFIELRKLKSKKGVYPVKSTKRPNNRMHSDHKNRRSYLALLFVSGDARRYT